MTKRRKPAKTKTTAATLERTIQLSTTNLLACGALVLGQSFGFTDAEQAQWITETVELARQRIVLLGGMVQDAADKLKDGEND